MKQNIISLSRHFTLPASALTLMILLSLSVPGLADEFGTDVSGYLGKTVSEVRNDFPELYSGNDSNNSGRDYLTDGKVLFYYEYNYSSEGERSATGQERINRIVLNNLCGSEYRIGSLPGGSTYGDEYGILTGMGYEFLYGTGDIRHFWMDEEGHLIIVTRGMWAGACKTDYSLVETNEFWE